MALNNQMLNTLTTLAQTCATDGHALMNAKSPLVRALQKDGFIEGDLTITDPNNADKIGFKVTEKGYTELGFPSPGAPVVPVQPVTISQADVGQVPASLLAPGLTPVPPGVPVVQVAAGKRGPKGPRGPVVAPTLLRSATRFALPAAPPAGKRGGLRGETYPFESLAAPDATGLDSVFVQATAALPNPIKTLKAAVFSANKRYKEAKKGNREFAVRDMGIDPEYGVAGARIFRVR